MAKAVDLTLEADLTKASAQFVQAGSAIKDIGKAMAEMTNKAEKLIERMERVGQTTPKNESAFAGLTGKLLSMGAALSPLAAGMNAFNRTLDGMTERSDRTADKLKTLEATMKQLVQIAKSPTEYAALVKESQALALEEGMTLEAAQALVFSTKSLGVDPKIMARVASFTDPQRIAESVGTFQAAFGKREAGDESALIAKFLSAAGTSKLNVEDIAPAAARAAASASRVGGSDEELLALMGQMSNAQSSPEIAADRLKALIETLERGYETGAGAGRRRVQFKGLGILGGLEKFRTDAPAEFAKALLERPQAAEAVETIDRNRAAILTGLGDVTSAGRTRTPLKAALEIAGRDPALRAVRETRAEEAAAQVAEGERYGEGRLGYDRALAAARAYNAQSGRFAAIQTLQETEAALRRRFFGDENAESFLLNLLPTELRFGGGGASVSGAPMSEAIARQLREELARNTRATERNSRSGGPELRPPKLDDREGRRP